MGSFACSYQYFLIMISKGFKEGGIFSEFVVLQQYLQNTARLFANFESKLHDLISDTSHDVANKKT